MRDDLPLDVETVLAPGEVVLDFTDGMFKQGTLVTSGARRTGLFVTDRRVGFFTRKIGGHKVLDFAYGLPKMSPDPGDKTVLYIDQMELQTVVPDHVEGWDVSPGKIAFSHAGYVSGSSKTAIAQAPARP